MLENPEQRKLYSGFSTKYMQKEDYMFAQQLVNGLSIGCMYSLVSMGYSMVYGILRIVNFAHGEYSGRFYTPIPEIGTHRSDMKETAIPF